MKKFFKECDEDQDGTVSTTPQLLTSAACNLEDTSGVLSSQPQVSKREMWNFLHKQGVEASKEEFISFFNELDDDQTGTLSFKQFVTGIQGLRKVRAPSSCCAVAPLPVTLTVSL